MLFIFCTKLICPCYPTLEFPTQLTPALSELAAYLGVAMVFRQGQASNYDEYNFFVSSGKVRVDARGGFSAPWMIFWVAFAVRLAYVMLAHTYRVRPYDDHFGFGWEMGRIARALTTGYGYADPFRSEEHTSELQSQ